MELMPVAVAAAAAAVATGIVAAVLPRLGVIDVPNHRSSHSRPVPRGGGVGVIVGVASALLLTPPDRCLTVGLLGALLLAVVGFVDDIRSLPAMLRLAVQVSVAAVAAVWLMAELGTALPTALGAAAAGTLWLAGYVNLFNFMDGANGLAGLNALVAGVTFATIGSIEDSTTLLVGGSVLVGAAAGFLPWNFPHARIFLGDVGSYSIGFLVAWLALVGVVTTEHRLLAAAPMLLVLLDTSLTLLRRARRGATLMAAHREHVYQRLTPVPGSPLPAIVTFGVGAAFVAAVALPTAATLAMWVVLAATYVAMPEVARRVRARTG